MSNFVQKQKNWWNEVLWKPKKPRSLEHLKYLYMVLERNPVISDGNRNLIVETLRAIAEILIWGDQNDSSVWDFFLEKNMQAYFQQILSQRCGRYVVLQLLQTLSILFENIRNETSIYYLLSNNHINSIIVLKLDFSDEEVLAYYISFLKTLSFKLNKHTVHFFYNEHLRDFPLYTEAIKFFNHPESMVRIAVRTLTLNVYKVNDKNMQEFIRNKTAAPYFSNLVWFIGNHVIQLDACLGSRKDHHIRSSLESLVAEHLDHLHYINDIVLLDVECLNEIIIEHLLDRLLIPLYVYSLFEISASALEEEEAPHVSSSTALFLLSQVFLTLSHPMLMTQLAYLILTGDHSLVLPPSITGASQNATPPRSPTAFGQHRRSSSRSSLRGFLPPEETLDASFQRKNLSSRTGSNYAQPVRVQGKGASHPEITAMGQEITATPTRANTGNGHEGSSTESQSHMQELRAIPEYDGFVVIEADYQNISPVNPSGGGLGKEETESKEDLSKDDQEEEEDEVEEEEEGIVAVTPIHNVTVKSTVFIDSILSAMIPSPNDDSRCLLAISLIYSLVHNQGVNSKLLEAFSLAQTELHDTSFYLYNELLGRLLSVIEASAVGSVRLVTLHMCSMLVHSLVNMDAPVLTDHQSKKIDRAMEGACLLLGQYFKTRAYDRRRQCYDDTFLEVFEDEYIQEKNFSVKVPHLLMDATILLPPATTPLSRIDLTRRFPCGEMEKIRWTMRVFFAVRSLWLVLTKQEERDLPLTPPHTSAKVDEIVDTTNCDLVACRVVVGDRAKDHFMLVTDTEFMLVNPDMNRLGCGIVKFIAFLQDVEVAADPADNCALYITAHHRIEPQAKMKPALNAKIVFEDHIRCLATKQSIQKHKEQLRHDKMACIAKLLSVNIAQFFNQLSVSASPSSPHVEVSATDSLQQVATGSSTSSPRLIHSIANQTLVEVSDTTGERRASEVYEMDILDEPKQSLSVVNGKTLTSSRSSDSVRYSPVLQQISIPSSGDWKVTVSPDSSKQAPAPVVESSISDGDVISVQPLGDEKRSSSPLPNEEAVHHSAPTIMATSSISFPPLTFDMSSEHIITPTKTGISLTSGSSSNGSSNANSGSMGMSLGGIGILPREPSLEERTPSPRQSTRREGNLISLDPETPQLFS